MGAKKKSKRVGSASKAPGKGKTTLWPEPCTGEYRNRTCGGKIVSHYNYGYEETSPGIVDPQRKYRRYNCQRCGKEWRMPILKPYLYDPDKKQPLIGDYTLKATQDPYASAGAAVKALISEAQRQLG